MDSSSNNNERNTKSGTSTQSLSPAPNKPNDTLQPPDINEDKYSEELMELYRERDRLQEVASADRAAMKQTTEQRKKYESQATRLDRIVDNPNYYRLRERKKVNSTIWLRLLATVLLLIFAYPISERLGTNNGNRIVIACFLVFFGLLLIWYKHIVPIKQSQINKKRLIDSEHKKQLREKIIQCEIQLTSITHKYEKSKQALEVIENKIATLLGK